MIAFWHCFSDFRSVFYISFKATKKNWGVLMKCVFAILSLLALTVPANADDRPSLKIGVIVPMSGPQAEYGLQMTNGLRLYIDEVGNNFAGRKVELIVRDTGGADPTVAKRLTQELVVKDQVDFLAGYGFSPNAFAAAPIATEAGIPMVVMNAAASSLPSKSPYIVRFSHTLAQHAYGIAMWANSKAIRTAYTLYADYGPGRDANTQFVKTFKEGGGQILGEIAAPLQTLDFGPYMQRIKDARPGAVFMWFPSGELANTMLRAYRERRLEADGIRALGTSDLVDDMFLNDTGDAAIGLITSGHYSLAHDSAKNKAFIERYQRLFGTKIRPNFMAVAAYDGTSAIYQTVTSLAGKTDRDAALKILSNLKMESPRGHIEIDPLTRDIVQDIYIRETKRLGDGQLYSVEFDKFSAVKDPGK